MLNIIDVTVSSSSELILGNTLSNSPAKKMMVSADLNDLVISNHQTINYWPDLNTSFRMKAPLMNINHIISHEVLFNTNQSLASNWNTLALTNLSALPSNPMLTNLITLGQA